MEGIFAGSESFFDIISDIFSLLPIPISVLIIGVFGVIILLVIVKEYFL